MFSIINRIKIYDPWNICFGIIIIFKIILMVSHPFIETGKNFFPISFLQKIYLISNLPFNIWNSSFFYPFGIVPVNIIQICHKSKSYCIIVITDIIKRIFKPIFYRMLIEFFKIIYGHILVYRHIEKKLICSLEIICCL